MAKKCDVERCNNNVFGTDKNTKKRYCRKHQYLRSDVIKAIKHKSISLRNNKLARNKEQFNVFQYGFQSEATLFEHLWNIKPHVSEISGRDLDKITLFFSMFAHVLPKKKYRLFRYNPENIMLIHPMEHVLIDQGSSSARKKYTLEFPSADFSIFYQKKEELLKSYPKKNVFLPR